MKKLIALLNSSKLTIVLLIAFAWASGYGTFLENDFGTPAVRAVVYDSWWFELIMALLAINFILNIFKHRLLRKEKWATLVFHVGFIVVLIGAFVSRYTGFEGVVNIREGKSANSMLTNKSYLTFQVEDEKVVHPIAPTILTPPEFDYELDQIHVKSVDFIPSAERSIVPGNQWVLTVVVAQSGQRATYFMERGRIIDTPMGTIGFMAPVKGNIEITLKNDSLFIESIVATEFMNMATQANGSFKADTVVPLQLASLYRAGDLSFVVKDANPKAKIGYSTTTDKKLQRSLPGKVIMEVASPDETHEMILNYVPTKTSTQTVKFQNGKQAVVSIGPEHVPFGFNLFLKDFELIRYPGSTSPSSYSSYIEVIDGETRFDYTIFMNNVLDYKGFRFFQASFDTDEKGTVLSVNHDRWGTIITYLGYALLIVGMIWDLFSKSSRFSFLNTQLSRLKQQKKLLSLLIILFSFQSVSAQITEEFSGITGIFNTPITDQFGSVLIQDMDGRIKPVNTLASELTRKLTGKTKFNFQYDEVKVSMTANQLFVALHAKPEFWAFAPVIKVDPEKGAEILKKLHQEDQLFVSLRDFFDEKGSYLLQEWVDEAYALKPDQRGLFDEEVIKVDERFNILYQVLTDSYMKIFPKPNDLDHAWYTDKSVLLGLTQEDSVFVKNALPLFYKNCRVNLQEAEQYISYIKAYQKRYANEISPTQLQVKAEIWYNKLQIFFHLFYLYALFGLVLLVIAVTKIFVESRGLEKVQNAVSVLVFLLFALHTANILLRWFAGGYPPWSNGYEMTILVSWTTVLFGILFRKKTDFILALAILFSGTLLFVAFLDWLNPEITNLVPVLKSYWLKIHVAVIVGSYAPLALSALLGFTYLWLTIFSSAGGQKMKTALKEISFLNEISMTIGIYMLTIGTFLGGIWANESWGRYWGWDPKETWALISILVYAVILHLRLIPGVKPFNYWLNGASVVGFFSIIMTSFGVNYYLSGLHSYAQGDPVPIPTWVFWLVGLVAVTLVLGFIRRKTKEETTDS